MDFSLVLHLTGSGFFSLDAGILVDDLDVGITEIMRITVKKQIVSAGNCIGFDPVAGQNGVLHAIIAYK